MENIGGQGDVQVQEQIEPSNRNILDYGMENLMEMDEDSLFNNISAKDMLSGSTLKLHSKRIWDEFFKEKSLIGRAQLVAKLFR